MHAKWLVAAFLIVAALAVMSGCRSSDSPGEPAEGDSPAKASGDVNKAGEEAVRRGVEFLKSNQGPDGSFRGDVGITAICLKALVVSGKVPADDPAVKKATAFVLRYQKPDGGIYDKMLMNYCTAVSVMALKVVDGGKYADVIEKATNYLIKHQWDEGESIDPKNDWHGGAGYGKHERPDMSNLQYMLQALHEAGVPKDDPVWKRAIIFVSRAQNRSESNQGFFIGTNDGGFIYTPVGDGESKAGEVTLPSGKKGLKSYGSMTYAGFKSFIYANLKRDDPRVLAALDWIKKNWTVEENPGVGKQGLYYYYHTMAKALAAWGEPTITDDRGFEH
ncbi:MAG: terpene cyclase/mutase family protein, partial [Phycisphaerae bacterium]|nr:terpene cyclase/mutase family protein [Phycisphaerae bacterium]